MLSRELYFCRNFLFLIHKISSTLEQLNVDLTLLRNARYETPGYEKVRIRNVIAPDSRSFIFCRCANFYIDT